MDVVKQALPQGKTLLVDGVHTDPEDLWAVIQTQFNRSDENRRRWHLDDPIIEEQKTWVVNNNWGNQTRDVFKQLLAQAPDGFAVYEEGDVPESLV